MSGDGIWTGNGEYSLGGHPTAPEQDLIRLIAYRAHDVMFCQVFERANVPQARLAVPRALRQEFELWSWHVSRQMFGIAPACSMSGYRTFSDVVSEVGGGRM